jgi:hypothetical protein
VRRIKLILVAALFLIAVPTVSFAFFDVSAFGGYAIPSGSEISNRGLQYGFDAHVNMVSRVIFKTGFGGFYRGSSAWVDVEGVNEKFPKHQLGFSAYGAIAIPIIPVVSQVNPYFKIRATAWDRIGGSFNSTDYFKAYSWGTGILYVIFPGSGSMSLGIYGEYLCDVSRNAGKWANGHTLNFGVRADLF